MLRAADYRERARASLSGNWGMAVLICFVGALLEESRRWYRFPRATNMGRE